MSQSMFGSNPFTDSSSALSALYGQQAMQSQQYGLMQKLMQQQQGASSMTVSCSSSFSPSMQWAGKPQQEPEMYLYRRAAEAYNKPAQPSKGKGMFSHIATDVKAFIIEHRAVIYFVACALLIDHFLFRGVFRVRLQAVAEKLVAKVEERIA